MKYILIALLSFFCAGAYAQDAGLYEPMAAPDSAFVRFININDASPSETFRLNGKILTGPAVGQGTAYYPVSDKATTMAVSDKSIGKNTVSGAFYTVVNTSNGLVLIDDTSFRKEKSLISFYNFGSNKNLMLSTLDGKIDIAGPLLYGKAASKEINGVKISMAIYEGNDKLVDIGEKAFVRGMAYTVVAFKRSDGSISASIIEAAIDTKR